MEVKGIKTLGQVLEMPIEGVPRANFCVPRFQRKYDWEKEREVAQLVDDIFDDLEEKSFMGTIILRKHSDTEMEIIDGQQRLVTFAMFYRAFVDYSGKRLADTALTDGQRNEIIEMQHDMKRRIIRARPRAPVIRLARRIDDYFQNEILMNDDINKVENLPTSARGQHQSLKRLASAYVKIFNTLEEQCDTLQGQELLDKLIKISEALDVRQTFLMLTVEDESDAYNIFETINERGKRLSINDLMKNLCFRRMQEIGEDNLEAYANKWDEAEESLAKDYGSFLWHVWVSRYGTCLKNKVFRKISDTLLQMESGEIFDLTWEMIFEEATWYHVYGHPSEESASERMRDLEMLKCMRSTRCFPLLLGIDYALHKNRSITAAQANEIIAILTSLTFWHSGICARDAKNLEKIYHGLAVKIRNASPEETDQVVTEIITKLCEQFPSEDDCRYNFTNTTFSDATFIRGLLRNVELQRTIEKYGPEGERPLRSDSEIWLEHILPQNPEEDSNWMRIFPEKREREDYTYRLGNQTLMLSALDRRALNRPFEEKKQHCYSMSQIELTRDLLDVDEWNKEKIDRNTDKLFDLAKAVWPIP